MNFEPRTVFLSRDNFESAIESFLRTTDVIKDSETPSNIMSYDTGEDMVKIIIHFKEVKQTDETKTVH